MSTILNGDKKREQLEKIFKLDEICSDGCYLQGGDGPIQLPYNLRKLSNLARNEGVKITPEFVDEAMAKGLI